MNTFLVFAYLFFCGALFGWVIELLFRRFFSKSNPERKWINPGFCVGPYIPLYGFGLCLLYLFASCERYISVDNVILRKCVLIVIMTFALTLIEYLAGLICLKIFKVRLWDYSQEKFNVQGLICPIFTLIWGALSAVYLLFIHAYILDSLIWLSENLAFSFVIGFFYGIFIVDVVYSTHLIAKIKVYAKENGIIVKLEKLKSDIRSVTDKLGKKTPFLFPLKFHKLITERREKEKNKNENSNKKE